MIASQLAMFPEEDTSDSLPSVRAARCRPGDLWALGRHRLLCGDCTDAEQIRRLYGSFLIDGFLTDPPYNVGLQYSGAYAGQDSKTPEGYGRWLRDVLSLHLPLCQQGAPVFVWQAMANIRFFSEWFAGYDWRLFASCKNFVQLRRGGWMEHGWEPVVCWTQGERKLPSIIRDWHVGITSATQPTPDRKIRSIHPCPRPLDTVSWLVEQAIPLGGLVADAFLGSGTTLIACERTQRTCYGMEIEPAYCDVILTRWEKGTGQQAALIDRLFA